MAGRIFISYRRDDAPGDARGIRDALAAAFGRASVFMDIDNLLAGQRFDRELEKALAQCSVVLAVMGSNWLDMLHARLQRGERDYVREEIATALTKGVPVIPVRVGREGNMPLVPRPDELPDDVRELVLHQKHDVAHERFGRDVVDLIASIKRLRRESGHRPPWRSAATIVAAVAVGIACLAIIYVLWVPSELGQGAVPMTVITQGTDQKSAPERPATEADQSQENRSLDITLQRGTAWKVVKREFPDWYADQLRQAAALAAEHKSDAEVSRQLNVALVALRRQHATDALSASTTRLKRIASAFLDNLKALAAKDTAACYGFISQGETSPAVADSQLSPDMGDTVQAQIAAVFEAIADGRSSPTSHAKAAKEDYDILVKELTKLGWTEGDLQVFSNPTLLSREPPARVCKMVQDWFKAHLAVPDQESQERLLVETLKPVVSG